MAARLRAVLAAFLLLFFPLHVWAFRARPASDLRFERHASSVWAGRLASDGRDFMLLTLDRDRYFAQKIAGGREAGPRRALGTLRFATWMWIDWTGAEYLALARSDSELVLTRISRDGVLLGEQRRMYWGAATFANNRHGAMLVAPAGLSFLRVQLLTLSGAFAANEVLLDTGVTFARATITAAGDEFVVTLIGAEGTWLMWLRADGALARGPLLVDSGPALSVGTTYDGSSVTVLLTAGQNLRSAVASSDGTLLHAARTIHTGDGYPLASAVVWDGTQYIVSVVVVRAQGDDREELLRLGSDGSKIGDAVVVRSGERIDTDLATNGHDILLLSMSSTSMFLAPVDRTALTVGTGHPIQVGGTLTEQNWPAIGAARGQYLVAWIETDDDGSTIRASRVDAGGNYLDGAGIVLAPWDGTAMRDLSVDGDGPAWLVSWVDGGQLRGAFINRDGTPGALLSLGAATEAALRWNGSAYLVLRSQGSLFYGAKFETVLVTPDGQSSPPIALPGPGRYGRPALAIVQGKPLAFFQELGVACESRYALDCTRVLLLRLDAAGASLDAQPLQLAQFDSYHLGTPATHVASDGIRVLVVWSQYIPRTHPSVGLWDAYGAFVSAEGAPGTPFRIFKTSPPSVAFDGTDYVGVAWEFIQGGNPVSLFRIDPQGSVTSSGWEFWHDDPLSSADIASAPGLRPLAAFVTRHRAYDDVSRIALLFADEFVAAPTPPRAPVAICASEPEEGVISVKFEPAADSFGTSIELELDDGTFRMITVAPESATSARVSRAGLAGDAVRLRAWNGAGDSVPSNIAPALPPPSAMLRSSELACAGVPVTITATLYGIPPFTVRWSDGLLQSNIATHTVSRTLTLTEDKRLSITSIEDGSCERGTARETIRITVGVPPAIDDQTREVRIKAGQTAILTVSASPADAAYAWFEGAPGDTSKPLGVTAPVYITPPLKKSAPYWVRVSNRCGSVPSEAIVVTVVGRHRTSRH